MSLFQGLVYQMHFQQLQRVGVTGFLNELKDSLFRLQALGQNACNCIHRRRLQVLLIELRLFVSITSVCRVLDQYVGKESLPAQVIAAFDVVRGIFEDLWDVVAGDEARSQKRPLK